VKTKFACPRCRAVLNPGDAIILAVRLGQAQGLILLSPEPANYSYVCDDSFRSYLKAGDLVDFFCPICCEDLTSPLSEKLVEILVLPPNEEIQVAQFSRICGEHATFVYNGRETQAYGEDRSRFSDLDFGEYDRWW
jgi:hypothetical protein